MLARDESPFSHLYRERHPFLVDIVSRPSVGQEKRVLPIVVARFQRFSKTVVARAFHSV